MIGNAWEWSSSVYRQYPYRTDDGREDVASREARVVRGGSWGDNPEVLRASYLYRPRFPGHRVDGNRVGRSRRGDSEIAAPLEIVDPEPIVELFFEAPSPQAAFRGRCWARTAAGV
jgi:hypothetical protein